MECRILLIDDNPDDHFLFKRILSKSGIESQVTSVTNAIEGLGILKNTIFDCIFLDYNLPEMNGMDFLKKIREKKLETPVIMLTGQVDEKIIIKLMQEGAADYISKNSLNEDILRLSIFNAKKLLEMRLQKHKAEEALLISESRLSEAQTIAHVGNWEYNYNTHMLFLSDEAKKILGYQDIDINYSGFHFLRHVFAADMRKVLQAMRNGDTLNMHDITFRLHTRNKSVMHIHAKGYVIKNDEAGIHVTKGTIQDVTILKTALYDIQKARIGRKATTIVFGIAILAFVVSEAWLDPLVEGLNTNSFIGLSFKAGLVIFLKPIETFLEKFMLSKVISIV